ncbi:AMP deaminase [Gregarina niphandrodes]|uniref:AMP deaminase n=1 Tax=Gregarina niphandrodes TaxID=110365 RepID=A0A023B415_GRENI|nr:AMP deaminase [Gregarina niphandrodes]EZG56147.1 AMP deaminase [Gregarina niphandrodes]|eukprot:XP_011131320.1 AMP deaminase [Gregarina niphandrodes]
MGVSLQASEGSEEDDRSSFGRRMSNEQIAAYRDQLSRRNWRPQQSAVTVISEETESSNVPGEHGEETRDSISIHLKELVRQSTSDLRSATHSAERAPPSTNSKQKWNTLSVTSAHADHFSEADYAGIVPTVPAPPVTPVSAKDTCIFPVDVPSRQHDARPYDAKSYEAKLYDAKSVEAKSQDGSKVQDTRLQDPRLHDTRLHELTTDGRSSKGSYIGLLPPKQYTRLVLPSDELALRASRSEENVRAVKMISSALMLRSEFVEPYRYYDSPCVLPPVTHASDPWGSREPRFCPENAPVLENLRGYVTIEGGVVRVYTDLCPESTPRSRGETRPDFGPVHGEANDGEVNDGEVNDGEVKDGEVKDGEGIEAEKKDGGRNDGLITDDVASKTVQVPETESDDVGAAQTDGSAERHASVIAEPASQSSMSFATPVGETPVGEPEQVQNGEKVRSPIAISVTHHKDDGQVEVLDSGWYGDEFVRKEAGCGGKCDPKCGPMSAPGSRSRRLEEGVRGDTDVTPTVCSGRGPELPLVAGGSGEEYKSIIELTGGHLPSVDEYLMHLKQLMKVVQDPACKSVCYQRLKYLEEKFSFHLLFNGPDEQEEVRNNNHRDFYNVRKVDTHVHHSACMTQKHLLRFIRRKYRTAADEVVCKTAGGEELTLRKLFEEQIGLTAWETSIDHLDVHAMNSCFHRFDLFNSKYNPFGAAMLREVFLKTDNFIGGRYLAELTQEVIEDLEAAKYQQVEWRVSIYGHSPNEWVKLARWMLNNKLHSKRVRWVIQVPRLYHVYRARNKVKSMEGFLSNVFRPVIEAVLKPRDHPEIFEMLRQTVAWDSVDDESVVSKFTMAGGELPDPKDWVHEDNPPYAYWAYYMYANIRTLNVLLQARGLNPMPFRPHCGEAGSISHLASAGLLADGINHGIMLRKSPVLQYLYYCWQIGLAMSPLSNNALFHEITKSPFVTFFKIGLNVSLSSDDPLMFHFTDEALLEEYSVCAHLWKLSPVDLCEVARNSVLQSNFEPQFKRHWIGAHYLKKGAKGNDIRATNVPGIRLAYREEALKEELKYLRDVVMVTTN